MKRLMVIFFSFIVIANMISVFSCSSKNPVEPNPTNTAVPTATYTATVIASIANYHFDTDQTSDWEIGTDTAFSDLNYNTTDGHIAIGCMEVTGYFSFLYEKGEVKRYLGSATNFTGRTITAWINIPEDLIYENYEVQIQIFVQDETDGLAFTCFDVTEFGWQQYQWVLPESLNVDITKIIQVGIQIFIYFNSMSLQPPITILFDDITW